MEQNNEQSAPARRGRGRPRAEWLHNAAEAMAGALEGKSTVRKFKDTMALIWVKRIFGDAAVALPDKVLSEIGQLLFYDREIVQLASTNLAGDPSEASRAEIRDRLPVLGDFFEIATALRAKGWRAQAIAVRLRSKRMEIVKAQPRVSWDTRYERAVNAVLAVVEDRAFELAGSEGSIKELAVRLLTDALEAAEK
jgi:hypothetical protein